jgi:hypothetical protein
MNEDSPLLDWLSREPEWLKRVRLPRSLPSGSVILIVLFSFLLYGLFLTHKIDLVTADLGRHIENGSILIKDREVLERNYYSYTYPDFPVVNHHWATGLLFYGVDRMFGLAGVQLLFIALSLLTLGIFLAAGRLYARWDMLGFAALVALPLLAERTEVRPEVFSYLFAGLFFLVLCLWRERRLKMTRLFFALPLLEIAWVNTHIYFVLGPLIIGAFLLESALARRSELRSFLGVFCVTLASTLLNPFGYRALTEAVTIFRNYGYTLAENQSVFFMQGLRGGVNLVLFEILFAILVVAVFAALVRKRPLHRAHLFVIGGIAVMGSLAVRNLSLFGLFFIPVFAALLEVHGNDRERPLLKKWSAALLGILFALFMLFGLQRYFPYWRQFGIGLEKGNDRAAEFLRAVRPPGPMFNNYDIGGYLIYHLYPSVPVFVDNRTEAYPAEFFREVYVPMQEREEVWQEALVRYSFQTIVFSYRDGTPWGQTFLRRIIDDASWAPVFADDKVLVLVRRIPQNQELIGQYELPRSLFVFR